MKRIPRSLFILLAGVLSSLLVLGVGMVPQAEPAHAKSVKELEEQRERNKQEREELKASLEGTDEELSALYLELDETRRRLVEARTELDIRNEELAAAERELQTVRDRLEVAQAEKAELDEAMKKDAEEMERTSAAIGDVARSAYQGRGNLSTLAAVMNAETLEEFADSYSAMNNALRNQGTLLGELRDGEVVNENRQARLEGVEERITELEEEAEELVAVAEQKRAEAQVLVDEVSELEQKQETQAEEFEEFISQGEDRLEKLKSDDSDLAADIEAIHEAERKRKEEEERKRRERERQQEQASRSSSGSSSSGSSSSSPKPPPAGSGGGSGGGGGSSGGASGAIIPPVPRPLHVTSAWGYRVYPITGGWFMHNGVDLRSPCGEAQVAAASGTVTAVRGAQGNGTHGNQVMIDHGTINGSSYVTVYNHLSRFAVSAGQKVSQGQPIGYTGATGMVTGCHVHFEVWRNGSTIDPMGLPGFR